MNIFTEKNIHPMLIGADGPPFDDPQYLYETKWDGERCIAYLDPDSGTELRNKRNDKMLIKIPELADLHRQVNQICILDGELMILKDGKPDFYEIQRRSLMSNRFKIELASRQYPASFIAFDILYYGDRGDITHLPLTERKILLQSCIAIESGRMAISRYIEERGTDLYEIAKQQNLEGIIAKRKDSIYIQGKRTKDWIKIKNLKDDDFVVCGYMYKENNIVSLVLAQYAGNQLVYKGHVTLGIDGVSFQKIRETPQLDTPGFPIPTGNETAVWIAPFQVCTVKFMDYMANGSMRQPVFKGLRTDKLPTECISKT